jgi:hypothetical protein
MVITLMGSPLAAAEVSVVPPAVGAADADVSGAPVSELESLSSPHAANTSAALKNATTAGAR